MSQFNQVTLQSISDLFINLSAGWFGAAFIIPVSTRKIKSIPFGLLILNLCFAIIFLITAIKLRNI